MKSSHYLARLLSPALIKARSTAHTDDLRDIGLQLQDQLDRASNVKMRGDACGVRRESDFLELALIARAKNQGRNGGKSAGHKEESGLNEGGQLDEPAQQSGCTDGHRRGYKFISEASIK